MVKRETRSYKYRKYISLNSQQPGTPKEYIKKIREMKYDASSSKVRNSKDIFGCSGSVLFQNLETPFPTRGNGWETGWLLSVLPNRL